MTPLAEPQTLFLRIPKRSTQVAAIVSTAVRPVTSHPLWICRCAGE